MKIKNKVFAEGFFEALKELANKDLPGDLSWDLSMMIFDIEKQFKIFTDLSQKYAKPYIDKKNELIEKLGKKNEKTGNKEISGDDMKAINAFNSDKDLLKTIETYEKQMKELNSKEVDYKFSKLIVKKADLKDIKIKSASLFLLKDILDMRDK